MIKLTCLWRCSRKGIAVGVFFLKLIIKSCLSQEKEAKTPKGDSAKKRGRPKGSKNTTPKGKKGNDSKTAKQNKEKIVMEISDEESENAGT